MGVKEQQRKYKPTFRMSFVIDRYVGYIPTELRDQFHDMLDIVYERGSLDGERAVLDRLEERLNQINTAVTA